MGIVWIIYVHGNIRNIVYVSGRIFRYVLVLRIIFQCRMKSLQSLIDDLGMALLILEVLFYDDCVRV